MIHVKDLFDTNGVLLSHEHLLLIKSFPFTNREFYFVTKAFPDGLSLLMKSQLQFQEALRVEPHLMINGVDIVDSKCSNQRIHNTLFERRKISPRGKALWDNIFTGTDWQGIWFLPYKFCFTNKHTQYITYTIYSQQIYIFFNS